jgi:hypothetical protein
LLHNKIISDIKFIVKNFIRQYYGDTHQLGGTLSGTYMRNLFDDIGKIIKDSLPNAIISWDISAWIGESGMRAW